MFEFKLKAETRSDLGKGASRRLRRNHSQVPAVIYGGDAQPQSISVLNKDLVKLLENEAAFSHVITLELPSGNESVLIKALQRHPAKSLVLHVDFQRVVAGQKLTAHIPLHFINQDTCVGVKQGGGEISHMQVEVEISCLPAQLPEYIEVDMANLNIGDIVHLSDLKLPQGVELVALAHDNDLAVANVHAARVSPDASAE